MAQSAEIRHEVGFLSTLPLGSIIAWHRDLLEQRMIPLPPGWVECNGQTLDDPESPFHGQVIPNLNLVDRRGAGLGRQGGMFLRGGDRSGELQDDLLQSHTHLDQGHQHPRNTDARPERILHTDEVANAAHATVDGARANSNPVGTLTGDGRARLGEPVTFGDFDVREGSETRPANMSVVWIMKVKQITAAQAVPAVLAHADAPDGAIFVAADGRVGVGSSQPVARLDVRGRIRGAGTVEAWSAERTGFVVVEGLTPWTDIPGLAIGFELSGSALVQISAEGSQRAAGGTIQVAYRLVIDDSPRGDETHGERLLSTEEATSPWGIWTLHGFKTLGSGPHTLRVQTRQSQNQGVGVVCGDRGPAKADYAGGVVNLLAVYQ